MNTTKDFTTMGKFLFITLIVIVVASLLNVFWLHNPWMLLVLLSFMIHKI